MLPEPYALTPSAAALFGPNWGHINRNELEQHFWQNRRRQNFTPITRTLNVLIKHGYGWQCRIRYAYGQNPGRRPNEHGQQITLGDLAADAQTNQIKIVQYGPERQRIAAHFFSESGSRFQVANEPGLPAGLSAGYYTPSPEFLQIPEPIALMNDRQELAALLGPAHDPASLFVVGLELFKAVLAETTRQTGGGLPAEIEFRRRRRPWQFILPPTLRSRGYFCDLKHKVAFLLWRCSATFRICRRCCGWPGGWALTG